MVRGAEVVPRGNRSIVRSFKSYPFYDGATQKIVHVVATELAVSSDKMEKDKITSTAGCTSDNHKCYGIAGKLTTPKCKPSIKNASEKQAKSKTEGHLGLVQQVH